MRPEQLADARGQGADRAGRSPPVGVREQFMRLGAVDGEGLNVDAHRAQLLDLA